MRSFLFCMALLASGTLIAQNITGFNGGDKALIRFLEKNISWDKWEDSIPYRFTLAAVSFDSLGPVDTIRYSSEGYQDYKTELTRVLQKTKGMWNKAVIHNQILVIPFELINDDRRDNIGYHASEHMMSFEFVNLFHNEFARSVILARPVIIITYGPIRKKGPGS